MRHYKLKWDVGIKHIKKFGYIEKIGAYIKDCPCVFRGEPCFRCIRIDKNTREIKLFRIPNDHIFEYKAYLQSMYIHCPDMLLTHEENLSQYIYMIDDLFKKELIMRGDAE